MIGREETASVLVRAWLLGPFQVERRQADGTWEAITPTAWEHSYARSVFTRLLCTHERRAMRSDLMDDLWPDRPISLAERYLNNAASRLYRAFAPHQIVRSFGLHGRSGYELADQSILWTDSQASEELLHEAERLGRTSVSALPLLERASTYFARGEMLADESGQWCLPVRAEKAALQRCCVIWLADAYEAQGMLWHARMQYRSFLDRNELDEDILCRLLALLHRHNMVSDLRATYEEAKRRFASEGISLSGTTRQFIKQLFAVPPDPQAYVPAERPHELLHHDIDSFLPHHHRRLASVTPAPYTMAMSSLPQPNLDMLMRSRRQALHDILQIAAATLTLSAASWLPQESHDHLALALEHPAYVDDEVLTDLTAITKRYWGLSKNASIDLLSGMAGHFTTITQLLKGSHPTPVYDRLCALTSENALLLGKTFHDIREYDLAWEYYKFALKLARDTRNTDLYATVMGRIALLMIYWGQPAHALPLLHSAKANEMHNIHLRPWLRAIEAEIQSMLGNATACQQLLEQAKSVVPPSSLADDIYATGFNPSRAAGYEGACFVRLRLPERALPALEEALVLCEPTSLRRRSTLLADIGTVHAQLGDVKTACSFILQSVEVTAQTKSLAVLQRIYKGRSELDPWKDSADVKALDERVTEMFQMLTKLKEQV